MNFDLSKHMRDESPGRARASTKEQAIFNRYGRAVYRLKGSILYDYKGRPRGFVEGTTVYDLNAGHRGFWRHLVLADRMHRVIGFAQEANLKGLAMPRVEIPPLPYADQPEPALPHSTSEVECPQFVPTWSIMQLENLLPIEESEEGEQQ